MPCAKNLPHSGKAVLPMIVTRHIRGSRLNLTLLGPALIGTGLALSSCSGDEFTACEESTCTAGASNQVRPAFSGEGGSTAGGGSAENGTSGNNSGEGAGEHTGVGGAAGSPQCDGACTGATPVCDLQSNECVECTGNGDCAAPTPACDVTTHACVECTKKIDCSDAAKPQCDPVQQKCVECVAQSDCTSATASACVGNACVACTKDEECSNIAGKGVCDAGTCVQCTVAKEAVCGGKSCDPATTKCTTTSVGTVNYCRPCVADSECIGGNQADQVARCVPMKFMGTARPGGFCLKRVAKTCAPPFGVVVTASSLSGLPSDSYCGIDQTTTRCEAVLDLIASRNCTDGLATSCGCTRDQAGACTDSGQGGLCKDIGAFSDKCTIPCASADQCLTTQTCPGGAKPYCE